MTQKNQFWDIDDINDVRSQLGEAINNLEENPEEQIKTTEHIKLVYMGIGMIAQRQQKLERRVMAALTIFSVIISMVSTL